MYFQEHERSKSFGLAKSRSFFTPHWSCAGVGSTRFSALAILGSSRCLFICIVNTHRVSQPPCLEQGSLWQERPRGCPGKVHQVLGRMEAQALLQTLTMTFPILKAIHTSEKCVHGSARGFITGRVPCTWGCQITSDLPHPTPETQPACSSSSSHLTSQVVPYLQSSFPLHYVLPFPANKAPP